MPDTRMTDPLGRQVVLYERTWYGHILKGHPEVANARSLAERAVASPIEIRYSKSDPDCRLYYGPAQRKGVMIQVVVDVAIGAVKTAHLARRISGGPVEWSSRTP